MDSFCFKLYVLICLFCVLVNNMLLMMCMYFMVKCGLNVVSGNVLDFCETAFERFYFRVTSSA